MRQLECAALFLIFALALAGCSGDGGAEHTWDGPPDPGFGGSVEVEGFVEHAESVDEAWEGSPVMAATEFLRLDERSATRTSVVATTTAEGAGPHAVIVTLDGLLDDSVRTERWTLLFEPDGDTFTLTTAQWSQRCQPGRGHRGYAAEACV